LERRKKGKGKGKKEKKEKTKQKTKKERIIKMIKVICSIVLSAVVTWALRKYSSDIGERYPNIVWIISFVVLAVLFWLI